MVFDLEAGVRVTVRQPVPPRLSVEIPSPARNVVVPVRGPAGATVLSGEGPPASGSGLEPLDGIHDPWRWAPDGPWWVGPAYEVTWSAGDEIPTFSLPVGGEDVVLYVTEELTYLVARNGGGGTYLGDGDPPLVKDADGSGIAFLAQAQPGYTDVADEPPNPELDVLDMLGDVTVGDPYTFPEPPALGHDGDFYIDTDAETIYGPRTNGDWGDPTSLIGPPGEDGTAGTEPFVWDQIAPAATWTITHDRGRVPASVQIVIGGEVVDTDIDLDDTTVTLTFASAAAGTAHIL